MTSYSIKEIKDNLIWDEFIDRENPSTFMQSFAWGEAEAASGKKIFRFGVFDGTTFIAAALFVLVRARRGNILICPHGPIIADGKKDEADVLEKIMTAVRNEMIKIGRAEGCVVARICPILLDSNMSRTAFAKAGFRKAPIHVYPELSWILNVTPSEDDLLSGMKKNTRYGIRKAEKDGITITSSKNISDFETFWSIYMDTATRQSFVPHPRKLVEAEFKNFAAQDRAQLYFAYHDGKVISTAMIIYGSDSAFYHHGASYPHSKITPGELLQWQIIHDAKIRGLSSYNFWGVVPSMDEGKKKVHAWQHLDRFKRGFGGYEEKYVRTQDYPLSWKYAITYLIESIRRWKRKV